MGTKSRGYILSRAIHEIDTSIFNIPQRRLISRNDFVIFGGPQSPSQNSHIRVIQISVAMQYLEFCIYRFASWSTSNSVGLSELVGPKWNA